MKSPDWLALAMTEFANGHTLYFVKDGDSKRLYNRLRQAARRRNYVWRFAIDGNQVVIKYKKSLIVD
jgi:3-methyladenine DNA glycosylase Mpg